MPVPTGPSVSSAPVRRAAGLLLSTLAGLALAGAVLFIAQRPTAALAGPLPAVATARTYPGASPCDTTLQACIEGSSDGDSINIQSGLYITSVTLDKAVSLIGAGSGATELVALSGQRVMTVTAAMTDSTQIAGMTLQGGNAGSANGGGILLAAGAQPLLQNLIVSLNSATNGGGLYATSAITLNNVTVSNNTATNGSGGGMYAVSNTVVINSLFQNNTVITNGSGGGLSANASLTGLNTDFIGNTLVGFSGGGLYAGGGLTLTGGLFASNTTSPTKGYGGGGGLMAWYQASISGTQFLSNTTADWGGGAYIYNFAAPSVLTNVTFNNNIARSGGGGGLFMWYTATLSSVDFFSNTTSPYYGGGAYLGYAASYPELVQGGRFFSNTASYGGGAFGDGSLTLADTQFRGNSAKGGRGGGAYAGNIATLSGGSFISDTASGGGGLFAGNGIVLTGTQFLSNTSLSGNGGGAWTTGNATVDGTYFAYNTVITGGNSGGLDTAGSLTATNATFFNNRTLTGNGGGSGAGGNIVLNNVAYTGNSANYAGGVLAFGTCSINAGQFQGNHAAAWGGGVYCGGPTLAIAGTQVLSNSALGSGGGTFGNTVLVTHSTYLNNSSGIYGGGLEAFGPIQAWDSQFQSNHSGGNGGAFSVGSSVWVTNSQFINNTSQGDNVYGGGAIAAVQSITATNSQFTGNTAATSPGGAVDTQASLFLSHSDFTGNTATTGDGGAAYAFNGATVDHVTFTNNQAHFNGGALALTGTLAVSSTLVTGNFANTGGGLYQYAGDGRLVNSLVANNSALSNIGQQLYLAPTGTLQLLFDTVGAPSLTSGDAILIAGGTVNIEDSAITNHGVGLHRQAGTVSQDYNLLFGNTNNTFGGSISGGTHDVSGNPRFVNPAAADYHLQYSSAARHAGLDVGVAVDFEGDPRPSSGGFDVGYDQTIDTAPTAVADAYTMSPNTTLAVTAPGVLSNDADVDLDPLTAVLVLPPASGTLALAPSGAFTYTPPLGFIGPVTFTYRAKDSLLLSPPVTVTITVSPFFLHLPLVTR